MPQRTGEASALLTNNLAPELIEEELFKRFQNYLRCNGSLLSHEIVINYDLKTNRNSVELIVMIEEKTIEYKYFFQCAHALQTIIITMANERERNEY